MLDKRNADRQIAFRGFTQIKPIADRQTGPTCGFEAIENIIQLFHRTANDLTEKDLLPRASHYGFANRSSDGYSLDPQGYGPILTDYGIAAQWYPFDHLRVVIPALHQNRGVLLVGDAHYLNPKAYPNLQSWHAFVLTNYYTDESGLFVLGYAGVDSNFANQETLWPYQNVEAAAAYAMQRLMACPVLITDAPGNWSSTARYYRLLKTGQLVPAR